MKVDILTRFNPLSALLALALACAALTSVAGVEPASPANTERSLADTQDVLTMRDGRVLIGKIVEESGDSIIFLYVDPNIRIQSRLTLNKRDIVKIERDVPAQVERPVERTPTPDSPNTPASPQPTETRERSMMEGAADDDSLPALYVIPMKGQMGTDIVAAEYRRLINDIRTQKPDCIIWKLHCSDRDDLLIPMNPQQEQGLVQMLDDYRELVRVLQDELRDFRQVVWVHDAVGISSVIALAWDEMYMTPNSRLAGMVWFRAMAGEGGDQDYFAKMREAAFGIGNGFLQRGGRSLSLGLAMMDPERVLSASWRGREVLWRNDLQGEYIVNSSNRQPATFRAKHAEDFGISMGTAETLEDLAMLLGYREYRLVEGEAMRMINSYVENWRRAFENSLTWWGDYAQHLSWAQGEQAMMYMGRARNDLDRILQAMNRYPAVEVRFNIETGMDKFAMQTEYERLGERIRQIRENQRRRDGRR